MQEEGENSPTFMAIAEDLLPHTRWTVIFGKINNGTFDDEEGVAQFIRDEKTGGVDQKAQVKTPFKRPRFGRNTFDSDSMDEGQLTEHRWAMAEDSFKTA